MKSTLIAIIALLTCTIAFAQNVCHFNKTEIPRHESRLLELARVIEFRCDCVIPKAIIDRVYKGDTFMEDTQFLAERYQDGKCVSRKFFSLGKYSRASLSKGNYRSIITFGWNMDTQRLVGVNDTGFFRFPGFIDLPNFAASRPAASFFKNSKTEPRTCARGSKFNLYPIIAINGDKRKTYDGFTLTQPRINISNFTSNKLVNHYKDKSDSVIVYLYFGTGTRSLDLLQDRPEKPTKMQNKSQ
ncbi:hypothetical protein NT6N_27700 [Oceaniferula spumae]|uniref:Uncharacterized protein n=1 Tax=Oceaniferula spumae TaxID=2979115 RepID=A0AAT9FP48_9BACT